jgi:DNA primase catalytic core
MPKQVLGDITLPGEGDIIDQVAGREEAAGVKARVDFGRLLSGWGIEVKQNGKGHKISCPFHEDTTPSCSVDLQRKIFHCFGCGEKGDLIDFVRLYKKTDFKGALDFLKSETGSTGSGKLVQVAKKREVSDRMTEKLLNKRVSPDRVTEQPLDQMPVQDSAAIAFSAVIEYYHKQLYSKREAIGYLEARGITDTRLYAQYKLGYADGSLLGKVSAKQVEELKRLGLVRESGKEHFAGCIVVPLFDEYGKAVSCYGRSVQAESKVPHLYLPGPHKSIFNRKAGEVYDEIIITEAIIDGLSLLQLGLQNVQALYGTNGFTDEHQALLKDARVKTVVLALDNDPAGRKASSELAARLAAVGIGVKEIAPEAKDWNEELTAWVAAAGNPAVLCQAIKAKIAAASLQPGAVHTPKLEVHKSGGYYLFIASGINYRVSGVKKAFVSSLRVNIKAELGDIKFMNNVDLYSARSRTGASEELNRRMDVPVSRIEADLLALVDWLEAERDRDLFAGEATPRELTVEEETLGLELLKSPQLFTRIVDDLSVLGYVGEELNKQLIYIAAASRKLDDPISVLILSQSASGKSLLVETVRKLIPPEDVVAVSSLSDQALNYVSEGGLVHKFLILGEAVHSDVVEHQIREMLSNHELSRMVTTKNEKTGQMETGIVRSEVIVAAMLSSTRFDVNPENASRCFVINTDESRDQTRSIHEVQKRKYSMARICEKHNDVPAIIRQHHAAQCMLKKRIIINPIAEHLAFPDTVMRTRRDHERFIDLIASVCFLRQYQKEELEQADPVTGEMIHYITCDLEDYKIAYRIMTESVLRAMYTELPKSLLTFYEELQALYRKRAAADNVKVTEIELTQRDIRKEITGFGQESIKHYLRKLGSLEYLYLTTRSTRGNRRSYRLAADEPVSRLDCSMIPSPEAIKAIFQVSG